MSNMQVSQKGAVLVISLIMLVMMTLVAVTGMQSSRVQEQMAGNQKQHVEAMLAAESGIAEAIACVKNSKYPVPPPTGTATAPPPSCGDTHVFRTSIVALGGTSQGAYWIEELCGTTTPSIPGIPACDPVLSNNPDDRVVRARARITSQGYSVSSTMSLPTPPITPHTPEILAEQTITTVYDDCAQAPIQYGIMSERDIDFSGSGTMNGSVYSDQSVDLSSRTVDGNVNVFGSVSGGTVNGDTYCPTCGVDKQPTKTPIPRAADSLPSLTAGMTPLNAAACNALTGDLNGAKYLCSTPVTLTNNIYNGTLYFQGSGEIRLDGGVGLGTVSPPLPVTVVAAGDIRFNGSNDGHMNIWIDGQYTQNGSSSAYGSIIARGEGHAVGVDWNGASVYHERDYGNPGACKIGISFE